ncbi:MAG: GNAT family N-acetyltransferase [Nitrospirae bacterium]|nr:GNAT family N-acetyltransferase [Candidatus Manganitrophaceae bacterium]
MVKALTDEITEAIGEQQFHIDRSETAARCRRFLEQEIYTIYQAVQIDSTDQEAPIGFITLCESHALYTEGAFGIIQELYVNPAHRAKGIGKALLAAAVHHGKKKGWTRLEVCTPPLPAFEGSVRFYERQQFEITGGRKMKVRL